jgi:2-polyprenyl-3-methyl-5-hydroxy-6-metoxy-1,4-benzoquinol methylase
MKKREAVEQLLEIESSIKAAFVKERTDYRGRVINQDHVLHYFYHDLYRMADIIELIAVTDPSTRVLDVGIAYGFMDVVLKTRYGRDVIGVELADNIPVYCDIPLSVGIPVRASELGEGGWPIEDGAYDIIVFGEVLEHLRISPLAALQRLRRGLRSGGHLLLTTPNIARLSNIAKLMLGRNILEEFGENCAGFHHITDSLAHIREYTMDEVKELIARAGLEVVVARHSWSWDRYNGYLMQYERASTARRFKQVSRSVLSYLMPRYRNEMILLARRG